MNAPTAPATLPEPKAGEHPFAPYVRILGKGKRGSRSLNYDEARHAMSMILKGEVEDVQLGAFLMLLRVKEETPDELAGFVQAVRDQAQAPEGLTVDIDWSSYAGKRRHAPWFLFSILLLADQGLRVFIHGAEGHTPERIYLSEALEDFGFAPAKSWDDAVGQLNKQNFSYLPLSCFAENLAKMIDLRPVMGLRSPVHSLARLINPLDAPTVLQGIFHPPYAGMHQQAALLLRYPHTAVIRGEGGEIERNPDNALKVFRAHSTGDGNGTLSEDSWPGLFERRHVKPDVVGTEPMRKLWRGEVEDTYGEAAVLSTAAFALLESGQAESQEAAMDLAKALWNRRDKGRF